MFLSLLHVNVGGAPDRDQPGRRWLRDVYNVHQRLWMAFPDAERRLEDPFFLGAWDGPATPEPKRREAGFLFRIERDGSPRILVQSAKRPDWEYAFQNAARLLAAPPETKTVEPRFEPGQHLRFRLLANPTKRLRKDSCDSPGQAVDEKWVGKRVAVKSDGLENWLSRRAQRAGFHVTQLASIQPGYVYVNKGEALRYRSAQYEGILEITDPDHFGDTLIRGIGPAKSFGFGLLSVAPVR